MKHILAALILALIMSVTHAARPEDKPKTKRCRDVSALHGPSVLVR
ncbi:MAG TPA: hypothetical protein VER58_00140 [Thermoanaerobaculia bacterium]|nr:hypothetical protein [Thermoanaerobaculia bacterium]